MENKDAIEKGKNIRDNAILSYENDEALNHLITLAEKIEVLEGSHILLEKKVSIGQIALEEALKEIGYNACREEVKMRIAKNFGEYEIEGFLLSWFKSFSTWNKMSYRVISKMLAPALWDKLIGGKT